MTEDAAHQVLPVSACKRIQAVLPDDGTDLRLLTALRRERGINRADSVPVRAVAALQDARPRHGHLPEPGLARLVTVVVDESEANAVFDFIHATVGIDRPGGGMLMMDRLLGATPFELPPGIGDEAA